MEIPAPVPGFGASVPATRRTPAARSRRTFSITTSPPSARPPEKRSASVWRCIGESSVSSVCRPSSATAESSAETMTESVGTTKMSASAKRRASASETTSSRHTCTRPSAPKAIASRAVSRVLTCTTAARPSACAAATTAAKAGSVDWSSTVVTPKRSASLSDDPALLAATPVPDSSCSMPASPRFSSTGCRAGVRLPTCRGTAVSPAPPR